MTFIKETLLDEYIGFDVDSNKTVACVIQKGQRDRYTIFKTDIGQMKSFVLITCGSLRKKNQYFYIF